MTYAQNGYRVTMRITEGLPITAGTVDFVLPNPGTNDDLDEPYWVVPSGAAGNTAAEACANEQCQDMRVGTGRTCVVVSSVFVRTRPLPT